MNDVREWLNSLRLGQFADAFEENALEWDLLGELSDDDLRTIGVAALGHRKRILRAIAETRPATPLSETPSHGQAGGAERRQLTVMFCDLVGSTELSQALDPEELREVNRLYQDSAKAAIERYGGYVARYMGDGVLAYFGYPNAHEDDAERAVRSGLELTERIPSLAPTPRLEVRVGIATGQVVVGDLIGEGASEESAVVGETPNLAARLQGAAGANTVTISDVTRELVAGLFECSDLGTQSLKGFAVEQRLWRVVGERQIESRFEALRSKTLSSFVGRDGELGVLLNRWDSATASEGQVVLIEGEAGIGKSRLAGELRRAVASSDHTVVHYQCSPHHTNSAFSPFAYQLEQASNIALGDSVDERLDKLEQLLPETTTRRQKALWLFANLLSLPTDRYPMLAFEPQELKSETIAELRSRLVTQCEAAPVLAIFEDVHWIDPTSLEVLDVLVQVGQDLPILFIVTHRPEFESPWGAYGFVTKVQLNRLPRRAGTTIIRDVARGKSLPEAVVQQILAKTDGVALFVEELTKTVLEGGLLREEADGYILDQPLPDLAIPSTLRDSLVARLDRLGAAKEVAQVAACIGREFSFRLLHSVVDLPDSELGQALEKLVDNELVYQRGKPPASSYAFKHALVQDAAFQTLLLKTRKECHGRIAHALEEHFPDTTNSQPELLAHHCTEAGLWEPAVKYWRKAGATALSRRANQEATWRLEQALIALAHLPETPGNREIGIDVRLDLRNSLFPLGELERILSYLNEAERLAKGLSDEHRVARVSFYLAQVVWSNGDYERASLIARRALATAEATNDFAAQIVLNFAMHQISFSLGDYPKAISFAERNVESLKAKLIREHFGLAGLPSVMARTWMAWSLAELGRLDEAASVSERGRQIAEECDHPFSIAIANWGVAGVNALRGQFDQALLPLEHALELCRKWSFRLLLPWTAACLGQVYALSGRSAEAVSLLEEAVRNAASLKGAGFHSLVVRGLGEAYLLAGQRKAALDHAQQALTLSRERKEQGYEAWALRLLGEIAADPSDLEAETAESYYGRSCSLADALGMRPLVAHCHLGLGILYHRSERRREAQERLSAASALFQTMGMKPPARATVWLAQEKIELF